MSRRTARIHAFHILFGLPFHGKFDNEALAAHKAGYHESLHISSGLEDFEGILAQSKRDAIFTNRLVWGVFERCDWLDMVTSEFLKDWDIDRIASADRAILRICIYEMLCDDTVPVAVAINEAIEISKIYSPAESPAFINGTLAKVALEIDKWRQVC